MRMSWIFRTGSEGTELLPRKEVKSWRPSSTAAAFSMRERSSFFPVRQMYRFRKGDVSLPSVKR